MRRDLLFYIILAWFLYTVTDTTRFYSTSASKIHDTFDNLKKIEFAEKIHRLTAKLQKEGLKVQKELGRLGFVASITKSIASVISTLR